MQTSINVNLIKIDSNKATTYYNDYKTSFLYQMSEPISVESGQSILYSLISATIPYTFYGLNMYNDKLDVKETINNVETTRLISIPHGNYDAYSFSKVLTQLLNTNNIGYLIAYNKINNKFSLKTTTLNTKAIFLFGTGQHKTNSCHTFLGLPKDFDFEVNNELIETQMITMNDIYHLQIKSDLGNQNVITADSVDNILEVVPITPSPLSFIYYSPHIQTKYLLSSNNLQSIKIELTDNYNRPIDLNGIPFVINIKIEMIKNDKFDIPTGFDPRHLNLDDNPSDQNALERIYEDPRIIDRPSPMSIQDFVEYNIIQNMLHKLSKKKKTKKI